MKFSISLALLLPALIGAIPEKPFVQRDLAGPSESETTNIKRSTQESAWNFEKEKRAVDERAPGNKGVWGLKKMKRDAQEEHDLDERSPGNKGVWGLKKVKRDFEAKNNVDERSPGNKGVWGLKKEKRGENFAV